MIRFPIYCIVIFGFCCLPYVSHCLGDDTEDTAAFYNSMVKGGEPNVAMLTMFMNQMPKGGDLHHHYSGTIYAETYLDWVQEKGWFIDSCTLMIVKDASQAKDKNCTLLTVEQLRGFENTALYRKLLTLWSDKDFVRMSHSKEAPDQNFFNTFSYFYPIAHDHMSIGLKRIKDRAIREKVAYIETMLNEFKVYGIQIINQEEYAQYNQSLRKVSSQKEADQILERLEAQLLGMNAFTDAIKQYLDNMEQSHRGIDDDQFTMRFQAYALRVLDPVEVFLSLLAGHIAAGKSSLVVGVNILGPEHNPVSIKDYTLHMRMFHFLNRKYPGVNKSLHAGELTLGMVRPENLRFHIQQARDIAGARRIGHGVGLMYELQAPELLKDLKENAAIEINLTSNEFILGVEGQEHPYLIYSRMGVPMVISSDDSGVSRNNLSNEYVLLAKRYRPSYRTLKGYVYNSIQYSFMSEEDKERVRAQIERQFVQFEKDMAVLYRAGKTK